jgi:uncharacterized protein YaiE (UPF0345 family)
MPDPNDIPYVNVVKRLNDVDSIREVPVIGNLLGTANTVIDYAESDCNPDWEVYVETLFPALGQALLVLLTFGLDDVLRGYLRPGGGRGFGGLGRASRRLRRPTRAQRARGLLRGGIPEIGELVGKNLPGAQTLAGRNVGSAEKFLWRVDGLAQRGLWYWMVADVLEDFSINWTTALYESGQCKCPGSGGVDLLGPSYAIPGDGEWKNIVIPTVTDSWGTVPIHDASGATIPAGSYGSVMATVFPNPQFFGGSKFNVRIVERATQMVMAHSTNSIASGDPAMTGVTVAAQLRGGVRYDWQQQCTDDAFGFATHSEAHVWVNSCP